MPQWDREWTVYGVKAAFAERPEEGLLWPERSSEDLSTHQSRKLPGWSALILKLPNPLLVSGFISDVCEVCWEGKRAYLHGPFQLNEPEEIGAAFKDVLIPEQGKPFPDTGVAVPSSAVKGVQAQHQFNDADKHCHGIRLDAEDGFSAVVFLKALTDHVAQRTYQWWLRSPGTPFHGLLRYAVELDAGHQIREMLRYRGAGPITGTWMATRQTQQLFGFERPVSREIWRDCVGSVISGSRVETGIMSFIDALGHYKSGDDERCILDLSICFEILESKRQLAEKGRSKSKNKQLLQTSILAQGRTLEMLKKLIVDRDHVAHGRRPYVIGKNSDVSLSDYLAAVLSVVNRYIELLRPGEYEELSMHDLHSTRKS